MLTSLKDILSLERISLSIPRSLPELNLESLYFHLLAVGNED
jgi:hypothetical protein